MKNWRGTPACVVNKVTHAGHAKTQDLYGAVPATHDFGWLETVVDQVMRTRMIEAARQLASDIEQVPDRKSLFAGQHGSDAVSLNVFHSGAELAFDFARAVHLCDIGTAQNLGALR